MIILFQVCFLAGLVLILLSFILGGLLDLGDLCDFGDIGDMGWDFGHFEIGHVDVGLPTSPLVYMAGITTFGGVGWLCMLSDLNINKIFIVLIAIVAAVIVIIPVNMIYRALRKAENTSSPDADEILGLTGEVDEKIIENRFGEVRYSFHGNTFEAPAKSKDGSCITVGTKVRIIEINDNVFYVEPLETEEGQQKDK